MINRTTAPAPDLKIEFQIPPIEKIITGDGIEIYFVQKNNLPVVFTSLICDAGSKFDAIDKKGLAYLTSLLIDECAGDFNALQLSDEFEKIGTVFSSSAQPDSNNFTLLCLKENFERSYHLLGSIITKPHFSQEDFDREKKKMLDRILQLKDEAGYLASTAFEKIVFKNSFYEFSEMGFEKSVTSITNNDVINFYKNYFSKNRLKFFVTGSLTKEELVNTINKEFAGLTNGENDKVDFVTPPLNKTNYFIIDKKDSAQCEIRIGHISKKRNSPDYYATRLMNTILGGQFSSRINLNLREDKGFTYGASSSFGYLKHAGVFEVNTAVNIENSAEAVKEILNELNGIKENITDAEIDFAKSYLIKQFPSRFETFAQIARSAENLVVHSLPMEELYNFEDKVASVDNTAILNSAKNNILLDNLTIVLAGDKSKILPQLKEQLNVTPIELDFEGNPL